MAREGGFLGLTRDAKDRDLWRPNTIPHAIQLSDGHWYPVESLTVIESTWDGPSGAHVSFTQPTEEGSPFVLVVAPLDQVTGAAFSGIPHRVVQE